MYSSTKHRVRFNSISFLDFFCPRCLNILSVRAQQELSPLFLSTEVDQVYCLCRQFRSRFFLFSIGHVSHACVEQTDHGRPIRFLQIDLSWLVFIFHLESVNDSNCFFRIDFSSEKLIDVSNEIRFLRTREREGGPSGGIQAPGIVINISRGSRFASLSSLCRSRCFWQVYSDKRPSTKSDDRYKQILARLRETSATHAIPLKYSTLIFLYRVSMG